MKTLNNVFLTLKRPQKRLEKYCLSGNLSYHLCVRFPLLVFQAQTRLISWLTLIRGHISEHSRVSYTACWEKWNAINQSGLLFNVLDSGNKTKCWLSQWCRDGVCAMHRKKVSEPVNRCRHAFVEKFSEVYWSQAYFNLLHQHWYKWDIYTFKLISKPNAV